MDAETFEEKLTYALNNLTPEEIEHIKNDLGEEDYPTPEYLSSDQVKCKYCHEPFISETKYADHTRFTWWVSGRSLFVEVIDFNGTPARTSFPIVVCPICGRLLR